MSKTLVLAEKPSVGRDLAKVLKCNQNKGSYIEGSKYIVTWAMGHLVGLMDPEGYDNKYKEWKMETLPMLPKHMKLTVLKKTGKQYNEVKKQLQLAEEAMIAMMNNMQNKNEKQYNMNKAYILLKDLQNTLNKNDTDIFYLKYKNLMQELNVL